MAALGPPGSPAGGCCASTNLYQICVTLTDPCVPETGNVSGATIAVTQGTTAVGTSITDGSGHACVGFNSPTSGIFTITASKSGYKTRSTTTFIASGVTTPFTRNISMNLSTGDATVWPSGPVTLTLGGNTYSLAGPTFVGSGSTLTTEYTLSGDSFTGSNVSIAPNNIVDPCLYLGTGPAAFDVLFEMTFNGCIFLNYSLYTYTCTGGSPTVFLQGTQRANWQTGSAGGTFTPTSFTNSPLSAIFTIPSAWASAAPNPFAGTATVTF